MAPKKKILISEEISPYNIALVLLIKLYILNLLPIKRKVLFFLVQQIEGKPLQYNKELRGTPSLSELCNSILDFHSCGQSGNTTEKKNDISIKSVVFMLLDYAWSMDTGEDMYRQMNDVYALLLDPSIITCKESVSVSPRSVVGRFVQKMVVAAKLLHFDESILLFQTFCLFRESSLHQYQSLKEEGFQIGSVDISTYGSCDNPTKETLSNPKTILYKKDEEIFKILQHQLDLCQSISFSRDQDVIIAPITKANLESLIDAQIKLLERHGTPTPPELRSIMEQMTTPYLESSSVHNTHSSAYPLYHYLRYLTNLHEGNYIGAFDSLHQYFDYMVSQGSKYFYHFALIARASLHQSFGEYQKALDSIEEAISVARENKDNSTLTYIISWLFNFMKEKPDLWVQQSSFQNNSELQLLDFLNKKSQSVSLLLAAVSFCFTTENLMSTGESSAKIYESLFKALYVSINDVPASFIKCCELASLVWDRLGIPYLRDLYIDVGLSHASEYGLRNDSLTLLLRKHQARYKREKPEEIVKALKSILNDYIENIAQLERLQKLILLLKIESDLRNGRVSLSWESLKYLVNSGEIDEEAKISVIRLHTDILAANNDYSGAINLVSREISRTETSKFNLNLYNSINLNLIKTSLLITSEASPRAFSLLVQQIKLAKRTGFGTLLMTALIQMVSYLNKTLCLKEAYDIGLRLVPAVTHTQDQQLISDLYYELAKSCCAFLEDENKHNIYPRKDLFANFLKFLSLGIAGYKKSTDLRMLTECFRLEQRVAVAGARYKDEMASSLPFQNFKKHSKAGLEILQKRTSEACDHGYLNKTNFE